jgi:hypothetical protein
MVTLHDITCQSTVQYFNWFLAVKHRFVALGGWTGTGPSVRGSEVQKTVLCTEHSLRHFKTVQTCFIGPSQIYRHTGLLNFTEGPWHQMLNRHSSQILWPKNPLLAASLRELTVNSWKTQSILHLNISAVQISTLWDPAGRNMCLAQPQSFLHADSNSTGAVELTRSSWN